MGRQPLFTIDDVCTLRKEGYLVMSLPDASFIRDRARTIFNGLELIRSEDTLRQMLLHDRPDNKDRYGRLVQGYFEKPMDQMRQLNFVSFEDGRFGDYIQNAPPQIDPRPLFEAIDDLNARARWSITDLAKAIDDLTRWETKDKDKREQKFISVEKCITHPQTKTITSATSYLARSGTDNTSPRPNTAAFAIYWLAQDNPGMQVMNMHGEWKDLKKIEVDPTKAIIIPGRELALVTRGKSRILESMHPIYPQNEDSMRSTLRSFVYIKRNIINLLENGQEKPIDALLL